MKRIITLLAAAALLLTLVGCSKAVGGTYKLEYCTAEGVRFSPSNIGMIISFELNEDGTGSASNGAAELEITWEEDGSTVVVNSPDRKLEFSKDGENLVLHDEGTMLFFVLQEEEEGDD